MPKAAPSTTTREALLQELRDRDAHHNPVTSNPHFIAADDLAGEGHSRATREVARFSQFTVNLVKDAESASPEQAEVKVPRLIRQTRKAEGSENRGATVDTGWLIEEHALMGAVTLKPKRPSKFGNPDSNEPSRKLAEFCQGEGEAWTSYRDDAMPELLLAWANTLDPTPIDAQRASQALAIAMAARAGIAVQSTSHLPF